MTTIQSEVPAPNPATTVEHVLTLDCREEPGIVNAVSGFLLEHGCDIIDNKQFGDRIEGHFFMRVHFASPGEATTVDQLRSAFAPLADKYGMRWQRKSTSPAAGSSSWSLKFATAVNDLLFRARSGSPHRRGGRRVKPQPTTRRCRVARDPVLPRAGHGATKPAAEARLLDLMTTLTSNSLSWSPGTCSPQRRADPQAGRAGDSISTTRSCPASGRQAVPPAYARGVKTVGATAHYVNAELDEGPIISQQVVEVDHTYGPEDLVAAGRDTECRH
jgi:formyltetrahydrofolate deformylase